MLCQNCQQNEATIHVTDIDHKVDASGTTESSLCEQHLCEACAKAADVPHGPKKNKSVQEIFKLLQMSAQKVRREPSVTCPDCGMTLAEFRQRGRLGCPKDYDLFGTHLAELVERVHGAAQHVGRKPGVDDAALARLRRVNELQAALENAIRAEAYENAARIRDELKTIRGN
ncbi:MAG: UvrB/UvrC motif-containing protein [Planctomycetes bacterium]|nr:UvrB/UvrC motif-containing protein [Planctomycetota bacterium]